MKPLSVEAKPWGVCTSLALTHTTQLDDLMIEVGGYSSLHFHNRKHNGFLVDEGELWIYWPHQFSFPTVVKQGRFIEIPPGFNNTHQFYAPRACRVQEFYWQPRFTEPLNREDIVRLTRNGKGDFVEPTLQMAIDAFDRFTVEENERNAKLARHVKC